MAITGLNTLDKQLEVVCCLFRFSFSVLNVILYTLKKCYCKTCDMKSGTVVVGPYINI